jgi:hypothetical protein
MPWLALLLLLAQSFWQTKPPMEWTDIELSQFLADSPWAQMVAPQSKNVAAPPVQVYLATAGPIAKALAERERRIALRRPQKTEDPLAEEYQAWLADNRASQVILAVRVGNNDAFSSEAETRRMEQECSMELDHFKVKPSSYFPPTPSDPYLRLAFPRSPISAEDRSDKSITFQLYLPGVPAPYRVAHFKLKDMILNGHLEM